MRQLIAASIAAAVAGCAAPARQTGDTAPPQVAAAATQTLTGVLDLVIGDPASSSGSERVNATLVDNAGKRTSLLLLRRQLDALGTDARRPGFRATVVGEPTVIDGGPALRVLSISAAPPS